MAARRTERLLEVVLCLTQSRAFVTKAQLRQAIEDYAGSVNDVAFERMFERDKADLRELGIPLETGGEPGEDEGYRIDLRTARLPSLQFTPEEATALALARRVWHAEGSGAADRALRKLEASGVEVDRDALLGVQPWLAGAEQAIAAVGSAVTSRREIAFDYRRSGDTTVRHRRLQPWGLVTRSGRYYVVGYDLDRAEPRAFRLDRVSGEVVARGPSAAYEIPADLAMPDMVEGSPPGELREAVLRVRSGRGHLLRARALAITAGDDGWDEVLVEFGYTDQLAGEILALAPHVVAVSPESLRASVVAGLQLLVDA